MIIQPYRRDGIVDLSDAIQVHDTEFIMTEYGIHYFSHSWRAMTGNKIWRFMPWHTIFYVDYTEDEIQPKDKS